MDEQPVKSKKSHYILTFVIGISVIGVIIVILGIATNWFRGSSPNGPAGGSPGGYNCNYIRRHLNPMVHGFAHRKQADHTQQGVASRGRHPLSVLAAEAHTQ